MVLQLTADQKVGDSSSSRRATYEKGKTARHTPGTHPRQIRATAGQRGCDVASLGSMNLKGNSGRGYSFEIYALGTSFQNFGAVYAVTRRHQKTDGSWVHTVIYVGETGELGNRLSSHHKQSCFDTHQANRILVHSDGNESSRLQKEADLIANYNPPCND